MGQVTISISNDEFLTIFRHNRCPIRGIANGFGEGEGGELGSQAGDNSGTQGFIFLQYTAKQGHTAGLQTKGLHGGGSHLGQFISGMGNNGLRRGIALLQGRVQQGARAAISFLVVVGA